MGHVVDRSRVDMSNGHGTDRSSCRHPKRMAEQEEEAAGHHAHPQPHHRLAVVAKVVLVQREVHEVQDRYVAPAQQCHVQATASVHPPLRRCTLHLCGRRERGLSVPVVPL